MSFLFGGERPPNKNVAFVTRYAFPVVGPGKKQGDGAAKLQPGSSGLSGSSNTSETRGKGAKIVDLVYPVDSLIDRYSLAVHTMIPDSL